MYCVVIRGGKGGGLPTFELTDIGKQMRNDDRG